MTLPLGSFVSMQSRNDICNDPLKRKEKGWFPTPFHPEGNERVTTPYIYIYIYVHREKNASKK
jgi:hypothetical protein